MNGVISPLYGVGENNIRTEKYKEGNYWLDINLQKRASESTVNE